MAIEDSFKERTKGPEHADKVQVMAEAGRERRERAAQNIKDGNPSTINQQVADKYEEQAGARYDGEQRVKTMTDEELLSEHSQLMSAYDKLTRSDGYKRIPHPGKEKEAERVYMERDVIEKERLARQKSKIKK